MLLKQCIEYDKKFVIALKMDGMGRQVFAPDLYITFCDVETSRWK